MKYLAALALLGATCIATAQAVPPGTYVTEGGWGVMRISPGGAFEIEASGTNAHTCEVSGVIRGGKAATGENCTIAFDVSLDRITVSPDINREEACRVHCGMRAHFAADYFREIPACRAGPVSRERDAFLSLYRAKQYRQAAEVLSTLLHRCGRFLEWRANAEVRNDLALAYHHAKDDASCIGVLEPLRRAFIEDPAITGRAFAPVDEDWGEEMVKRTRTNRKLCGGSVPGP